MQTPSAMLIGEEESTSNDSTSQLGAFRLRQEILSSKLFPELRESETANALLADIQLTSPPRCPVLLTDSHENPETSETRPPPPAYDPKPKMSSTNPDPVTFLGDKDHLYSTVQKSPLPPVSILGGGSMRVGPSAQ
ncbi:transforming growth factor beta-1-induced transcript 1 protein-like [Ascaphus truei]|uniref:transforming growth factor beta-1-induced transcript 1 protein-like n=1 Tax=Ascaphus truei TaxID=8439 RepID=UPI003F59E4C5